MKFYTSGASGRERPVCPTSISLNGTSFIWGFGFQHKRNWKNGTIWLKTQAWRPVKSAFVICSADMPILPEWMRWMAVAGHFSPCGVKSWKSTSQKMLLAKFRSAKGDQPRDFRPVAVHSDIKSWLSVVDPEKFYRIQYWQVATYSKRCFRTLSSDFCHLSSGFWKIKVCPLN